MKNGLVFSTSFCRKYGNIRFGGQSANQVGNIPGRFLPVNFFQPFAQGRRISIFSRRVEECAAPPSEPGALFRATELKSFAELLAIGAVIFRIYGFTSCWRIMSPVSRPASINMVVMPVSVYPKL